MRRSIPSVSWCIRRLAITACLVTSVAGAAPEADRSTMNVPGEWAQPVRSAVAAAGGWAWYRAWVKPEDSFFKQQERNIGVESIGITVADLAGAHEVLVNGTSIGTGGGFPPGYASGREQTHRHKVPVGTLRQGDWNEIVVRVYVPTTEGQGGFLGEAPFLMNYFRECIFEGAWEFHVGRDQAGGASLAEKPSRATFDAFRDSSRVLGRTEQVHGPRLPPLEAAATIRPAEPFQMDLLLHEPTVAQPFHVSFDERGRMWVTQSRQYPYPAGLRMISRDKYYRAHYDKVPPAPPHHDRGADVVSVHESTKRDGVYDRHTVFLDGLNMANAALRGRGGVWVMHTPYLLFYPDADFDDVPDGPPEVRLAGFGMEDSHAIANGLVWGPDGWLYGAQGSTSSCSVTRPGDDAPDAAPVRFTGCMVWRYHPESRAFEIFTEGGGNNFGLEFDAVGRLFGGHNGPDTRGFHFVPGGIHQMQAAAVEKYGPPRNPYAFGALPQLASDDTIVRFTHNGCFADGTAMPADRAGHLFSLDPLHNLVTDAVVTPRGATFRTKDLDPAVTSADVAFRPVYVTNAADGSLCICDMYEFYVTHGQHYQNQIDPTTGRIYRLRGRGLPLEQDTDLSHRTTLDLVGLLGHPNKWHRQTAVRLLGERRDQAAAELLRPLLGGENPVAALHALWAFHQIAGLDETSALAALDSRQPAVRSWAVRLLGDTHGVHRGLGSGRHAANTEPTGRLPDRVAAAVLELARKDDDPEVLCQILATARRLDAAQALPLAIAVLSRESVATDPYLPLMGWWVFEPLIPADNEAVLAAFAEPAVWQAAAIRDEILPRLARRWSLDDDRRMLAFLTRLFKAAPAGGPTSRLLEGFVEAFRGRSISGLPDDLLTAIESSGTLPLAFRLRRGNAAAVAEAVVRLRDRSLPDEERLSLVRTLGELRRPEAADVLRDIALGLDPQARDSTAIRAAAMAALASFPRPTLVKEVLDAVPSYDDTVRVAAFTLLASRPDWSAGLLDAIASGKVATAAVPQDVADRLRGHKQQAIREAATRLLPVAATPAEAPQRRIEEIRRVLAAGPGDPYAGRGTYLAKCSQCHRLFHDGGNVGPVLTTYQRDDLGTMLRSIVEPSAEIREGYQYYAMVTEDGRSLTGFVVDRDAQATVLRTLDGETVTLAAAEIDEIEPIGKSIMPAGLLDGLDDRQLRDFFAYLRIKQPIGGK